MHLWRNKLLKPLQKVFRMLLRTLLTSKKASKGVPKPTRKTPCVLKNTVNTDRFSWFYYCLFLCIVFHDQDQSLNAQSSKHALCLVSSRFWGAKEHLKVVISLQTSVKNQVFKKCTFKTSSKALWKAFETVMSLQNEGQERPQGEPRTLYFTFLMLLRV